MPAHRAVARRLPLVGHEDASAADRRPGETRTDRGAPLDDEPVFREALDDPRLLPHGGPVDTAPLRPVLRLERGGAGGRRRRRRTPRSSGGACDGQASATSDRSSSAKRPFRFAVVQHRIGGVDMSGPTLRRARERRPSIGPSYDREFALGWILDPRTTWPASSTGSAADS